MWQKLLKSIPGLLTYFSCCAGIAVSQGNVPDSWKDPDPYHVQNLIVALKSTLVAVHQRNTVYCPSGVPMVRLTPQGDFSIYECPVHHERIKFR